MAIYIGKRTSSEGWVSFESNPHHKATRKRVYTRCAPCLESFLDQLTAGKNEIHLDTALNCWKVVAVLPELEQCYAVLDTFETLFPDQDVIGKFGGGKNYPTKAVMFHTEEEKQRDKLFNMLKQSVVELSLSAPVFYSRGCANPYEILLGPWQGWKQVTPICHPEHVQKVINQLRWSLYERSN